MKFKIIECYDEAVFEKELESFIEILEMEKSELMDIKFSMAVWLDTTGDYDCTCTSYSALVIYKKGEDYIEEAEDESCCEERDGVC